MISFLAVAASSRTLAIRSPWIWAEATPGAGRAHAKRGGQGRPGAGRAHAKRGGQGRPDLIWPGAPSSGATPMRDTPISHPTPKRGEPRLAPSAPRGSFLHPSRSSRSLPSSGKKPARQWTTALLALTAVRQRGPGPQIRKPRKLRMPRRKRRRTRKHAARRLNLNPGEVRAHYMDLGRTGNLRLPIRPRNSNTHAR